MNEPKAEMLACAKSYGDLAREEWLALLAMKMPKDEVTFRRMLMMAFIMGQVLTDEYPSPQ